MNTSRCDRQAGLTLVELMIAIAISMLVVGAVASLYVNASRNFREDDQYARMLENGRFAMYFLGEDLQMANFWGYDLLPSRIQLGAGLGGDCGVQPFKVTDDEYGMEILGDIGACATAGMTPEASNPILLLKRVSGKVEVDKGNPGTHYPGPGAFLLVSPSAAKSVQLADKTTPLSVAVNEWVWRYSSAIYFLNTEHELCRIRFESSTRDSECLVKGIERMHVQFGVDNVGNDGLADTMVDAAVDMNMKDVVSARVCIVARTERTLSGHDDDATYDVCGQPWTQDDYEDGFQRRVFEKTFQLRNNASMARFRQ